MPSSHLNHMKPEPHTYHISYKVTKEQWVLLRVEKCSTRGWFRWLIGEVTKGLWVLGHWEELGFVNNCPQFFPSLLQEAFAVFKEELGLHGPEVLVSITNHSNDLSYSSLGFFWHSNGAQLHIPCHLPSNLDVLYQCPP